jgi:Cu(I)/Ag(I) efflux system protein CusF
MDRVLTGLFMLVFGTGSAVAEPPVDTTGQHAHEHATAQTTPSRVGIPQTDGEIIKVDTAAKKLTVKHGRIENLGMAPMTMPYAVKESSFLTLVKPGDKVKMTVEQVNGAYTIVALQKTP